MDNADGNVYTGSSKLSALNPRDKNLYHFVEMNITKIADFADLSDKHFFISDVLSLKSDVVSTSIGNMASSETLQSKKSEKEKDPLTSISSSTDLFDSEGGLNRISTAMNIGNSKSLALPDMISWVEMIVFAFAVKPYVIFDLVEIALAGILNGNLEGLKVNSAENGDLSYMFR